MMFLSAYVPMAFADTLPGFNVNNFDYQVTPDTSTHLAFDRQSRSSAPIEPQVVSNSATSARARWAWIVANTSLVMPVVLALVVLFVIYRGVVNDRDVLSARTEAVLARQNNLIELQNERLASLQKLEEALVVRFLEDVMGESPGGADLETTENAP